MARCWRAWRRTWRLRCAELLSMSETRQLVIIGRLPPAPLLPAVRRGLTHEHSGPPAPPLLSPIAAGQAAAPAMLLRCCPRRDCPWYEGPRFLGFSKQSAKISVSRSKVRVNRHFAVHSRWNVGGWEARWDRSRQRSSAQEIVLEVVQLDEAHAGDGMQVEKSPTAELMDRVCSPPPLPCASRTLGLGIQGFRAPAPCPSKPLGPRGCQ